MSHTMRFIHLVVCASFSMIVRNMFLICVKLLVCLPTEFYMHYFFGERGGEGRGTVSLWLYSLITVLLLLSFNILAELFYCCNEHLLCKTYC